MSGKIGFSFDFGVILHMYKKAATWRQSCQPQMNGKKKTEINVMSAKDKFK